MIDEVKPAKPAKAVEAKKPEPPDPHAGMVLSSTGVWQPADRPYRPGRKKVHAVHTNRSNRARGTAPYTSAAEQMLFSAFSTPLGIAPRPLPKLVGKDRAELVNALVSRNDATDKDPENLKIAKEILQRAKDEMRKFLKEGGEPDDFFRHYHDLQQTAYLKRLEAMKEIRRIAREEADPELARALRDKVNEGLKAEGIMPVHADISDNPEDN